MSNDSDGDMTSEVHNEVHIDQEQDHVDSTDEHHDDDDEHHHNPANELDEEHEANPDHETNDNQQHNEVQESTDNQSLYHSDQQSPEDNDEHSTDDANEQSSNDNIEQASEPSTDLEQTISAPVEREQLDVLNNPDEVVTYQSDDHVEPSSPSFIVEHQHMDTQTVESTSDQHSPADAQSPHSSVSTPRDVASDTSDPLISQQLVVVDPIIKVIAPLPPRQCTLVVTTDDGVVNVEIMREYLSSKRQFLGGYRGHKSGRVKLHASTQTARRRTKPIVEKSERTTQTVATVNRAQQTLTSVATQMDRRDWCPVDDPTAFKPIYL